MSTSRRVFITQSVKFNEFAFPFLHDPEFKQKPLFCQRLSYNSNDLSVTTYSFPPPKLYDSCDHGLLVNCSLEVNLPGNFFGFGLPAHSSGTTQCSSENNILMDRVA